MLEPQNQAQAWWLDSNLNSAKLEKVENIKLDTTLVLMQSSVSASGFSRIALSSIAKPDFEPQAPIS